MNVFDISSSPNMSRWQSVKTEMDKKNFVKLFYQYMKSIIHNHMKSFLIILYFNIYLKLRLVQYKLFT